MRKKRGVHYLVALALVVATWVAPGVVAAQRDATIQVGDVLALRMNTALSSKTSRAGDRFTATVFEPLRDRDGRVIVPQGSTVEGRVTNVEPAKRLSRSGTISVEFDRLVLPDKRSVPIFGQLTSLNPDERKKIDEEGEIEGESTTKRSVIFIGGGAGVGAIIGAVAGSAGVGTGIGAGLGTAAVLLTKGNEAEINQGFEFGLEVLRPVTIATERPRVSETFESENDILYVQRYLADRGLYTGQIDGRLSPATRAALVRFQRDERIAQSGAIDLETALAIGLVDDRQEAMQPVRVLAVDSRRVAGGIDLDITAQTNSGGWGVYENHFVNRNTVHVYVRGVPPQGPATQAITPHNLQVQLSAGEARGVTTFVVHGADGELSGQIGTSAGGGLGVDLRAVESRLESMKVLYERTLGIRVAPRTGDIAFTGRNYTEGEIELLVALSSLHNSTRLLSQLSTSLREPEALRGATVLVVRDGRQFDRLLERNRSQRTSALARDWTQVRPEFVRLAETIGRQFERDTE